MSIAETILKQLGGRKFVSMTGCKNFLHDDREGKDNWLRMDLTRNASGANRLKITLEANDTYTMLFYSQRMNRKTFDIKITEKAKIEGVYCDQLESTFSEVTNLNTRLF